MKIVWSCYVVLAWSAALGLWPRQTASAATGLPCRYEIAHVITVPPCIFQDGVNGLGISPDGRYVCGGLSLCETPYLFIFDTQTGQRQDIALPPGVSDPWPLDITDGRMVAGYSRAMPSVIAGSSTTATPASGGRWRQRIRRGWDRRL